MTVTSRNQRQLDDEIRMLLDGLDRGSRSSLRELADRIAARGSRPLRVVLDAKLAAESCPS
jgi:hypothetical protein